MSTNPLHKTLAQFYQAARHLWGRCPHCEGLFRMSDAAVSYGSEPPRDWLQKLQHRQDTLEQKQGDPDQWQAELDGHESDLGARERELQRRERDLEATARSRAREMLKDDSSVKRLVKEARSEAVSRSRSTLLGNLFERLAPFLQRFDHDPRDVRPLFNPIDYVCFDGLTTSRAVERITFVEVKTGTGRPSPTQRSISEAIARGRVSTEVWQFGDRGLPIEQQLLKPGRGTRLLPPGARD